MAQTRNVRSATHTLGDDVLDMLDDLVGAYRVQIEGPNREATSASEVIRDLVRRAHIETFGDRRPARKHLPKAQKAPSRRKAR